MKIAVWSALGVFATYVFAVGALGWLAKPFMSQTIRQMVARLLTGSGQSKRREFHSLRPIADAMLKARVLQS
ncbi:hypothetical protein GPL21_34835 [Bradyrhizobium pachyrhizi]|uniref:Uncharacterized protein n=1 Tax=Bradyrhizobium pachyrhizi TaxID=280333 RepID=A0A844SVC1_9BRAD|nr:MULTISPECIES: hypothetical protein [Bradyrhizobium]MVT70257.1 hypothetical protein [Bradyrhizobium pachyrhizi]